MNHNNCYPVPGHKRSQIQILLRELRDEDQIHVVGRTRGAKWFPGGSSRNCNNGDIQAQ